VRLSSERCVCPSVLSRVITIRAQYLLPCTTRVLMKIFNTRSRDITEQCQLMFDMLLVADQVFMRKVRFLVRFRHSENLICSLFVSNASNEIAFICKKYSANETNIYMHVLRALLLDMNRFRLFS